MKIDIKETNNDYSVLIVEGEIDILTCEKLEKKLEELIDRGITRIVLEFEKVTYISSAGIRVLFIALQKILNANGFFGIVNSKDSVKEVLYMVGLQNFVRFYESITDLKKEFNGEDI